MPSLRSLCPLLFLVFSLGAGLFLAWALPPFMAADELAHLARADAITRGQLVSERARVNGALISGGPVDVALLEALGPFDPIAFHPEVKVTTGDFARAGRLGWDGRVASTGFANTAVYAPFFYAPIALGLAIGKTLHLSVIHTVYLGRALNVLACALVGAAALWAAGRARLPLYALLLLPMSVALYASATQDGLMVAVGGLAAALLSRSLDGGRAMTRAEALGAAVAIALVGMAKAPYAILGLVLLASDIESRRLRWAAVATAVGVPLLWLAWNSAMVQLPMYRADAVLDPGGQVRFVLSHPAAIGGIALRTLAAGWPQYRASFIGVLGWLDTRLPSFYYACAYAVLVLAFAAVARRSLPPPWKRLPLTLLTCAIVAAAGVFAALYVVWSPVGGPVVDGVQGRYFLVIAMFLPLALSGERPWLRASPVSKRLSQAAAVCVLAFPLVSMLIVERAVLVRYYLS